MCSKGGGFRNPVRYYFYELVNYILQKYIIVIIRILALLFLTFLADL